MSVCELKKHNLTHFGRFLFSMALALSWLGVETSIAVEDVPPIPPDELTAPVVCELPPALDVPPIALDELTAVSVVPEHISGPAEPVVETPDLPPTTCQPVKSKRPPRRTVTAKRIDSETTVASKPTPVHLASHIALDSDPIAAADGVPVAPGELFSDSIAIGTGVTEESETDGSAKKLKILSIVRLDAESDSDSDSNANSIRFTSERTSAGRVFEFSAFESDQLSIDPQILQLPRIFRVAEVRMVQQELSGDEAAEAADEANVEVASASDLADAETPEVDTSITNDLVKLGFNPIGVLSINTATPKNPEVSAELQEMESTAGEQFAAFGTQRDVPQLGNVGLDANFFLDAGDFCYQPLYFEEINLERFGTTRFPRLQPAISGARFFVTVPALPYLMTVHRPRRCYYDLSPYRPGRMAPWHHELPEFKLNAATVETAVLAGLFLIIP